MHPDSQVCTPPPKKPEFKCDVFKVCLAREYPARTGDDTWFLRRYTLDANEPGIPRACYLETVLAYVEAGTNSATVILTIFAGEIAIRRGGDTNNSTQERVAGTQEGIVARVRAGDSFFTQGAEYELKYEGTDRIGITVSVITPGPGDGGGPTWPT